MRLPCILGYLDMLTEDYHNLEDQVKQHYIAKGLEASTIARDIVAELLEFARGESDETTVIKESVEMTSFTQSTLDCHAPKALEKRIELKMTSESQFLFCNINRAKLSRVIDNLVTNAIKFTPEGGSVSLGIDRHSEGIVIKVADNGIGIPDELKPHLFDPFSSSGRKGTSNEKSTGLGLSITKKLVELHSGKIWFESEEGKGSTFYLLLPQSFEEHEKTLQIG